MGGVAVVAGEALPKSRYRCHGLEVHAIGPCASAKKAPINFEKVEAARAEGLELAATTYSTMALPSSAVLAERKVCLRLYISKLLVLTASLEAPCWRRNRPAPAVDRLPRPLAG
jgi:hypothetical protein